jgi:hypothetical protein
MGYPWEYDVGYHGCMMGYDGIKTNVGSTKGLWLSKCGKSFSAAVAHSCWIKVSGKILHL